MKDAAYYERIEKEHGLAARRAAEAADKLSEQLNDGEISFGEALMKAQGSIHRPGQISGK